MRVRGPAGDELSPNVSRLPVPLGINLSVVRFLSVSSTLRLEYCGRSLVIFLPAAAGLSFSTYFRERVLEPAGDERSRKFLRNFLLRVTSFSVSTCSNFYPVLQ